MGTIYLMKISSFYLSVLKGIVFFTTIISSVFLMLGSLTLTRRKIIKLSSSFYGGNIELAKNFSSSQIDTFIGFLFLLIAIVLQFVVFLIPTTFENLDINLNGLITGGVISIFIFTVSFCLRQIWTKNVENKVIAGMKKQWEK